MSSEIDELKEAIKDSNQAQKRRHTESVHIIFASAVVGSFFTQPFQSFIANQNLEHITNIFVSLSIVYVILKLSEITLRDTFQPFGTTIVFGFLSPILYVVSVFGYLLVVFSEVVGFSRELTPNTIILFITLLFVISLPYAVIEFKKHVDVWNYSIKYSNKPGLRFEQLLEKTPSIIEDGLSMSIEQPRIRYDNSQIRLDYIGEDSEGNTVLIEAKLGEISANRAQYTAELIDTALSKGEFKIDRAIVAYAGNVSKEAEEIFESKGIELVEVDPYSAYGVFGRLFKIVDKLQGNALQLDSYNNTVK